MKTAIISTILLSTFILGAFSSDKKTTSKKSPSVQKQQKSEGRKLAELAFDTVDSQERGYLDMGQMVNFANLVHLSMDYDENSLVSLKEFMNWGFGMQNIAEDTNRMRAFNTALKVVYSFWDRNGDGQLSSSEHKKAIMSDFKRADLDGNGSLTKAEYLNGFSLNVAIRAALKD